MAVEEVGDDLRKWLSLRQWAIRVERNGEGFNVVAEEFPTDKAFTMRKFQVTAPLRRVAFHVDRPDEVVSRLEANGALTVCKPCGGFVRVEDEAIGDADQSFKCYGCGRRWAA